VAAALGINYSYWRKPTIGPRAPSLRVAFAIIDLFGFDDETAVQLLDESAIKRDSR
jgi:hypothetical protein